MWALIAAACSLVAAVASAWCAFMSWRVQDFERSAGLRPEIVLGGWTSQIDELNGHLVTSLTFTTVTNIGRGNAMGILINAMGDVDGAPRYFLETHHHAFLTPGECWNAQGQIRCYWQNVPADEDLMSLEIVVKAYDVEDRQFCATYSLIAARRRGLIGMLHEVAPLFYLGMRRARIRSRGSLMWENRWNWTVGTIKKRLSFRGSHNKPIPKT